MATPSSSIRMTDRKFIAVLIVLALVVGVLNILPPILIGLNISNSGNDFILAQQSNYRDEFFQYLPRAREVFDGHFPPQGVYLNNSGPTPLNPLPPFLFSLFIFLFSGNINWAYLSAQFVFSAIIFFLFFLLGWGMVRSKLWALFFACVGVFTQTSQMLFNYVDRDYWGIIFKKFIPIVRTPISKMYFARIDDPMLTYPILLVAMVSFYFFWIKPKTLSAVVAGVFGGLLAYTYLHYWLFWMIFLGIIFLYSLLSFQKDRIRFRNCMILLLTVFIILIPYFYNYFDFVHANYSGDYASRLGKEDSRLLLIKYMSSYVWGRAIILNHLFYLLLLLGVYYFYFKKSGVKYKSTKGIIFMALVITVFLVWQIPLFTGFGFALMHFNKPISLFVLIILFNMAHDFLEQLSQRKALFIRKLTVAFLTVSTVLLVSKHIVNVFTLISPPSDLLRASSFPKEVLSSWNWLNTNSKYESGVISSSVITSLYLSSYTHARSYLATGFLSTLTDAELEDRFLQSNKLFQVSKEVLAHRLDVHFEVDCSSNFCPKDSKINFEKTSWYLLAADYGNSGFYKNPQKVIDQYNDILPTWSQTGSDYVYYGPWEKQFSRVDFSHDSNLKLVYHNPTVEIYRVIKN